MKTKQALLLMLCFTFISISVHSQNDRKRRPASKYTTVETEDIRNFNKRLQVKGIRDSLIMTILGTEKNGRTVNVRCYLRKTEDDVKYDDGRNYKYYYEGKDSYYKWTIVFYKNRDYNIKVIQQMQGNYREVDTYKGKYREEEPKE